MATSTSGERLIAMKGPRPFVLYFCPRCTWHVKHVADTDVEAAEFLVAVIKAHHDERHQEKA